MRAKACWMGEVLGCGEQTLDDRLEAADRVPLSTPGVGFGRRNAKVRYLTAKDTASLEVPWRTDPKE
jgi:hypothetical protein